MAAVAQYLSKTIGTTRKLAGLNIIKAGGELDTITGSSPWRI